jgi:hypothetical protein
VIQRRPREFALGIAVFFAVVGTVWWRRKAEGVDSGEWDWSISSG